MPLITRTITAGDQFLVFKPAGNFLLHITGTIGSNTVRVQRSIDGGATYGSMTDGTNGTIGFTTIGDHRILNEGQGTIYRVGVPAADYTSGTFTIGINHV